MIREALIRWVGYTEPTWEPVYALSETEALDRYIEKYGPIDTHDGPLGEYTAPKQGKRRRDAGE